MRGTKKMLIGTALNLSAASSYFGVHGTTVHKSVAKRATNRLSKSKRKGLEPIFLKPLSKDEERTTSGYICGRAEPGVGVRFPVIHPPERDKRYSLAILAHEYGHVELLDEALKKRYKSMKRYLPVALFNIGTSSPVVPMLAGATKNRKLKAGLLALYAPVFAEEIRASHRGHKALYKELKKRPTMTDYYLLYGMPVLSRVGWITAYYGAGEAAREGIPKLLTRVRGYTYRRRGVPHLIRVPSYIRRLPRRIRRR